MKSKFCSQCGNEFQTDEGGTLCADCQTYAGKTRSCIHCGDLIDDGKSEYTCKRCREQVKSDIQPVTPSKKEEKTRRKILVIDDDAAMIELTKIRLETAGYEVLAAMDGAEGFQKISEIRPDLVISDVMMPKMTGYDLIKKLKTADAIIRHTPLIIITSKSDMKDFFSDSRVHSFIVKPFQADDLLNKVKELIALREFMG